MSPASEPFLAASDAEQVWSTAVPITSELDLGTPASAPQGAGLDIGKAASALEEAGLDLGTPTSALEDAGLTEDTSEAEATSSTRSQVTFCCSFPQGTTSCKLLIFTHQAQCFERPQKALDYLLWIIQKHNKNDLKSPCD